MHNINDGIAQYEDIKAEVTMKTSQITYEGLSDEVRHGLRIKIFTFIRMICTNQPFAVICDCFHNSY